MFTIILICVAMQRLMLGISSWLTIKCMWDVKDLLFLIEYSLAAISTDMSEYKVPLVNP